jgi:hypothetical protein
MKPSLTVSAIATAGTIHITAKINTTALFIVVPPLYLVNEKTFSFRKIPPVSLALPGQGKKSTASFVDEIHPDFGSAGKVPGMHENRIFASRQAGRFNATAMHRERAFPGIDPEHRQKLEHK